MNLNPTIEESLDNLAADILSSAHIKAQELVEPEWHKAGERRVKNWMHRAWIARTRLHDQEWISPQELGYQIDQINCAISKAQENGLINIAIARVQLDAHDGYNNPKFTPDDIGKFYFAVEAVEPERGIHEPNDYFGSYLPEYIKSTKTTDEVVYQKKL